MKKITQYILFLIVSVTAFEATIGFEEWFIDDIELSELEENTEEENQEKEIEKEVEKQIYQHEFRSVALKDYSFLQLDFYYKQHYNFQHSTDILYPPESIYS